MATYLELFDLRNNSPLTNKIAVAGAIKAQGLIDGVTPTAGEIEWANNTIMAPMERAQTLINYVLAANSGASVATITSASDATIQNNVDSAADALIAGGAT